MLRYTYKIPIDKDSCGLITFPYSACPQCRLFCGILMTTRNFSSQQMTSLFKNPKNLLTTENVKKIALLIIPFIVIIIIVTTIARAVSNSAANATPSSTQIDKPVATTTLNKDFSFSLKDSTGKTVSTFTYRLLGAELDKQIIVKGTRATAVDGRIFLIINLQLTNSQNQGMQVNTRDYVRLSVNGNTKEMLAPEIHNDPVEVQALSTKFTRIGFPINTSDKKYVLRIGEIEGDKKDIPLIFK